MTSYKKEKIPIVTKEMAEGTSLVALRQNTGAPIVATTGGTLEITFNWPRVASFVNATSVKQKALYTKVWNAIKNCCGLDIKESGFTFEYCQTGHVHLHGYIDYVDDKQLFPVGLVADYVKTYIQCLPKKERRYRDAYMYHELLRYRSPAITVQYTYKTDTERKQKWLAYINKCVQKSHK